MYVLPHHMRVTLKNINPPKALFNGEMFDDWDGTHPAPDGWNTAMFFAPISFNLMYVYYAFPTVYFPPPWNNGGIKWDDFELTINNGEEDKRVIILDGTPDDWDHKKRSNLYQCYRCNASGVFPSAPFTNPQQIGKSRWFCDNCKESPV